MLVGPDGGPSNVGGATATLAPPPPPKPPQAPAISPQALDRIDRANPDDVSRTGLTNALPHIAAGGTYVDHTGAFENVANGKLPPSVTIQENGYTFNTDAQGRVSSAEGRLQTASADPARSSDGKAAQREVGWEDRLSKDHGGHLIGHRFGGPEELHNLFAQDGNFNTGEYKKVENGWAKAVDAGKKVDVKVKLTYPPDSLRPTHVSVTTRIDDGPPKTRVFENKYKGGLEDASGAPRSAATDAEAAGTAARTAAAAEGATTASRLAKGAEVFGKVAVPLAVAADGYSLYSAYQQDGGHVGKNTVEQAGSVAGGWAGAAVGAEGGAEAGAAVGAFFGGVGAVPGAIIGGVVGGAVGGIVGSGAGKEVVKLGEDGIDAGKKALHSVASFFGL